METANIELSTGKAEIEDVAKETADTKSKEPVEEEDSEDAKRDKKM